MGSNGTGTIGGRVMTAPYRAGVGLGLATLFLGAMALPAYASGRIIRMQGSGASLTRSGQSRRALVGTVIRAGDLVSPTNGTRVTVQCRNADGSYSHGSRTRRFGLADVCPNASRRYSQSGRGEDDFLLFLEDRFNYATQVMEGNPTLRWNPVAGATTYQVKLWTCGQDVFNCTEVIWQTEVEGTTVTYEGEALVPGRNYGLEVTATDVAEAEPTYLMVRRLEADKAEVVQAAVSQLMTLEVGAEAEALARTDMYLDVAAANTDPPVGAGLVFEAIPVLEAVAPQSDTPHLYRQLGDLYLQAGLLVQAKEAYEEALALTDGVNDMASRAAAQVGLANIAAARGELRRAELKLWFAAISYGVLGDLERLSQVEGWLERLVSEMEAD
jgi:tetratricopeptide (TPR) repeat protein